MIWVRKGCVGYAGWLTSGADVQLRYERDLLTVTWWAGHFFHRLDGPAMFRISSAKSADVEFLSKLDDPGLMDLWLMENESNLWWYVDGMEIYSKTGKLTDRFPVVTREFINSMIETDHSSILKWIRVARYLGLMDSGLRRLEKAARLL